MRFVGIGVLVVGLAVAHAAPPVDVAAARAELLGADEDLAVAAATRLGQSGRGAAQDALLGALALGLAPRVAVAAIDALAQRPDRAQVDVLLPGARHRSPKVRASAVVALGMIDDLRARDAARQALGDADKDVRTAAGRIAGFRKDLAAVPALIALLKKGDEGAAPALAAVANANVAKQVVELLNVAPDALLAQCLGAMLLRKDLGNEDTYVAVVRALGNIPGNDAVVGLTQFLSAVPEKPARASRKEAADLVEQRLGGGGK